jgi:hypothetical protein
MRLKKIDRGDEMSRLVTTVIPLCFGVLLSSALRDENYKCVFVSIIGIVVCCLATILEG